MINMFEPDILLPCPKAMYDIVEGPVIWKNILLEPAAGMLTVKQTPLDTQYCEVCAYTAEA